MAPGPLCPLLRLLVMGLGLALLCASAAERVPVSRSGRAVTCEECGEEGAGDSRYSSRRTLTSTPRIAAPRPQPLTHSPLPRHHPLLSRQLLERRPRQVHGLCVVPGKTAQRLLPGLYCSPSSLFPAVVAHLGGALSLALVLGLLSGFLVWRRCRRREKFTTPIEETGGEGCPGVALIQ